VPKGQEVLTGEVTRFYHQSGNRPAKFYVTATDETYDRVGVRDFTLTVFPPRKAEQPWDEQTRMPILDNLPAERVGLSIQALAEENGEYNKKPDYKPTQITLLNVPATNGSTPPRPQAAPAAPAPAPAQRPAPRLDPQRDSIERQVAAKGAIELVATKAITPAEFDEWFDHILDRIQGREVAVDVPKEESEADDFGSL
jgi:hypothetical protein